LNAVPLPDHSLFDDAAVRAAPTADFFSQPWTEIVDLRTRRTNHRPFHKRIADSERFPHTEATDVESVGGDVFADHAEAERQRVQGFPVHQQNLAVSSRTRVCAALKPSFLYRGNRRLFLHGPAPFQSAGDPGRRTWALVSCGLYAADVSADVLAIVHSIKMNSFRRLIYKR
jgi:hypothetical protein